MNAVTERREITQIAARLDADAASRVVAAAGGAPARPVRAVWYPYYRFEASTRVRALFTERAVDVTCLVDARRGFASTAEPFPVARESVPAASVLETRLGPNRALVAARAYLRHVLSRRLRCIADFRVEPGAADVVYRKFWLIRCEARVTMVDSATGGLHVLREAA